jgi:hypothetical protein
MIDEESRDRRKLKHRSCMEPNRPTNESRASVSNRRQAEPRPGSESWRDQARSFHGISSWNCGINQADATVQLTVTKNPIESFFVPRERIRLKGDLLGAHGIPFLSIHFVELLQTLGDFVNRLV